MASCYGSRERSRAAAAAAAGPVARPAPNPVALTARERCEDDMIPKFG